MTKIEIINEIIVKKQEELKEVKQIVKGLEDNRTDKMFQVMQKYFGGEFTLDDVYINKPTYGYSGCTYEIKRPNKEYNYDKELMTIRFHEDWRTNELDKLETSLYSTSDNSQWELERIFTNGEVAKVLLDHGDDLLAEMNTVRLEQNEELSTARTNAYKVESAISKLKQEINDIQLKEAENKLNGEGIVAIIDQVDPDSKIAQEEIFGPVLSVITVKSFDEAIAVANNTEYGLAASVFTSNGKKAIRAARAIKAGTVTVNCYGEGDMSTPFGGYKQSGFGGRDNSIHAHDQYTELKTIWIDLSDRAPEESVD